MPRNESSRSAGKRPMRAMTPQEKMDAIGRVHTGESKAAVARDIGVPESTLRGWCKAEEKIRTQLNNVRATGSYEHILTSSSDNSDNSLPGSSSRSTPTTQNTGVSGVADKISEEPEPGPAPKRVKMENNFPSATASTFNINNINNMSARTSAIGTDTFNPAFSTATSAAYASIYSQIQSFLNGVDKSSSSFINSLMTSAVANEELLALAGRYSIPTTNHHFPYNLQLHKNNGAMFNMAMGNVSTANNLVVNGKKKYKDVSGLTSTLENPMRVATRRHNSQSPNVERPSGSISQSTNNRISPMPSTSANNGMIANISTKSSKDTKNLNAIICQLQQQHGVSPVQMCNIKQEMKEDVGEEMVSNNAMNNNNNNVDHVDNETTNRRSELPPGTDEMIKYCSKLIEWLQNHGSPICTFQQVTHIKVILENLTNWANSKEIEFKKKTNGTS